MSAKALADDSTLVKKSILRCNGSCFKNGASVRKTTIAPELL